MSALLARIGTTTVAALLLGTSVLAAEHNPLPASQRAAESTTTARVIVKYRTDGTLGRQQAAAVGKSAARPFHAAEMTQRLGIVLSDGRMLGAHTQVLTAQGMTSSALAARLGADSDVEYAVPDERRHALMVPNDPLEGMQASTGSPVAGQWYLRAPVAPTVAAINAEAAWDTTTGSAAVTVAVLDTGVRFAHPDLAGKLYNGYDFISDAARANDGDGRDSNAIDPGDGLTQAQIDADPADYSSCSVKDSDWHGTQVSGLIGANTNNGIGIASVGYNTMILPVRVLGRCGGQDADIIAGLLWAAGLSTDTTLPANPHPAQVINLSLGSAGACNAAYVDVFATLAAHQVTVVASAGNDGLAVGVPANCPNVIAVSGVRHAGTKVDFSSLGPQITVSAPAGNCGNSAGGECLYPMVTTTNTGTTVPVASTYTDGLDRPSLGTSFSSPLVAGTAALMLSLKPSLTPAQIKSLLQSSARAFPTTGGSDASVPVCHAPTPTAQDECYCTTDTCGAGLLDVAQAVRASASAELPSAAISASAASVTVGTPVTLSGLSSTVPSGRALMSYQWTISSGTALASFSSVTTSPTATLATTGAGVVTVSLTVTDNAGAQATSSGTINIAATPVTTAPPTSPPPTAPTAPSAGASSGGGGAVSIGWLIGLVIAIVALAWPRRRTAS